MTTDRLVRLLATLGGCLLLGACATTRYTQSRIEAVTPGVQGKAGSSTALEIEGLKLRLQTLDRTPEQEGIRNLSLRVVFEPEELGYSFDPGQVVLRTADGRERRAKGGQYLPIYEGAAFTLTFDAAVEPDSQAELVLGGLARGGTRLEPVTFRLGRQRGRSIDRMYWLEAIGTAVIVPLSVLSYGAYGGM